MGTTWVKLADNMPSNPKVRQVPPEARWAYVASICYCGHHLTDGFIPEGALLLIDASPKIAAALVAAGLWERAEGGWLVHDYANHNRTREQTIRRSQMASENGAIGLANRYQFASETASKRLANGSQSASKSLATTLQTASEMPADRALARAGRRSRPRSLPSSSDLLDPDQPDLSEIGEGEGESLQNASELLGNSGIHPALIRVWGVPKLAADEGLRAELAGWCAGVEESEAEEALVRCQRAGLTPWARNLSAQISRLRY